MALSDVAGVLSRKFILGFFVPVFFGILSLKLLVNQEAVPGELSGKGGGTQLLILGGFSLLIGLLLWSLHYSLIRLLEGYWLVAPSRPSLGELAGEEPAGWSRWSLPRRVRSARRRALAIVKRHRLTIGNRRKQRWTRARKATVALRNQPDRSPERTRAARDLTERFPANEKLVLPTEFGNVVRAFETHPRQRYGLDGIAVWPRIATMLTESERAEIEETTTDVAFWVNSLFVVLIGGGLLFVERIWHPPAGLLTTVAIEATIVLVVVAVTAWAYRRAIIAALRWGEPVRAAFDVHRFELYDKLGVRRPLTGKEEVACGEAVNRLLAFGTPVPDELRAEPLHDDSVTGDASEAVP